jgi:hypothetical protein
VNPLLLIAELERFDLTARRRSVMRTLILWQSELGVEQLRLDAACGALSGLCGGVRCFVQSNHLQATIKSLKRDSMILVKREAGALFVSVNDPHFWRCSQLSDSQDWLRHVNALRELNSLEQLKFYSQNFQVNEPTLDEQIASDLHSGALLISRKSISNSDDPSYSPHSQDRSGYSQDRSDSLYTRARARASNSISSNKEYSSRSSNSKANIKFNWQTDEYIVGKLTRMSRLHAELSAGRTKTALQFNELFLLDADRARTLVGDASTLPELNFRTKKPTDVLRWFNKSVDDQLAKAQIQ